VKKRKKAGYKFKFSLDTKIRNFMREINVSYINTEELITISVD
jgi:hypothetical protein